MQASFASFAQSHDRRLRARNYTNERLCECRTACTRVHEKSFECYGVRCSLERGSRVDSRTGPFKRTHRVVEVTAPEARLLLRAGFCLLVEHAATTSSGTIATLHLPWITSATSQTTHCVTGTIADHQIAKALQIKRRGVRSTSGVCGPRA